MANIKITDLTAYGNPTSTDVLPIVDVGADVTKKVSIADLMENAGSGTDSAPGIAFDGDSNTGIYRPGADQLAISTSGTERVEFGTSEVVFNDNGVNCDFRIEGDTKANLFFVDASTDRIGFGTSSPSSLLHVQTGNFGSVQIGADGSSQYNAKIFDPVGTIKLESTASDVILSSARHFIFQDENGAQFGRWASDGRLGIGTTSPGAALHVVGDIRCDGVYGQTDTDTSIQLPGSDVITFNEGGSEAARIDSAGRFLVGTSTAASTQGGNLQVDTSACVRRNVTAPGGPALRLEKTRASSDGTYSVVSNEDSLGELQYFGADGTKLIQAASITAEVDGTPGTDDMPGRLLFSTTADGEASPTQRMRITSGGRVMIGGDFTASSNTNSYIAAASSSTSTGNLAFESIAGNTALRYHMAFSNPNGVVGGVTTNGSATAFNTSSDYRLKENVVPLTGAANRVNQLQVHRFNFIADPDTTVDGFLAHEAQAVVPECVTGTKDEVDADGNPVYQGIDQSKLVPLLTAALQEALQKIETLEQRLNDAGIA